MKATRKFLAGAIATTFILGAVVPAANAEISASAGVASTYLWRGIDLGSGTPAVSGDLSYSAGGFYTTVWGSSGDTGAGTEWDLGAGYGGEAGVFSYDISIWNYMYPNGGTQEDQFGDLTEVILSLGVGPVSFSWYENVANNGGSEEYRYYTLGFSQGAFGVTLGKHDDVGTDMTHVDFSYAYNDNLSFIFSQVIEDDDDAFDDDMKFVVSYSIPIE